MVRWFISFSILVPLLLTYPATATPNLELTGVSEEVCGVGNVVKIRLVGDLDGVLMLFMPVGKSIRSMVTDSPTGHWCDSARTQGTARRQIPRYMSRVSGKIAADQDSSV